MTRGKWVTLWVLAAGVVWAVGLPGLRPPAGPATQTTPGPTSSVAGPSGHGPTQADRKAAEYWRKRGQARAGRQQPVAITWANLAQANNSAAGTSLAATVPVGGVAQNRRVVVCFAMTATAGTVSCADSRSNTYATDADVSDPDGCRLVVLSAPVTTALQQNDTITVTSPSAADRLLAVLTITDLASGGVRDQFATAIGNGSAPSSGDITTTVADEAILGVIAPFATGFTFTEGMGWTRGTSVEGDNANLFPEYRVASATGTFDADGTFNTDMTWAAAVVSYSAPQPTTFTPSPVSAAWVVNPVTLTTPITFPLSPVTAAWTVNSGNSLTVRRRSLARELWWRR